VVADFKKLTAISIWGRYASFPIKGNTYPVPSGTPPTVGHVWGMLKGVENVPTFIATIRTCSLNLYELGLVISDCFLRPPTSRTAFSANIRFLSLSWVKGSYPHTTQVGVLS